jgi:hypothetical protein
MSDNPLQKKLQIKPDQIIAIINPPSGYVESLGKLPEGVKVDSDLVDSYDLIHGFYTQYQVLENTIEDIKSTLVDEGILWISYPKQFAKKDTDLNRDILREGLAGQGLKVVSQISIDETWSALRFKQI